MEYPGQYVRFQSRSQETGATVQVLDLTHPDTEFEAPRVTLAWDADGNPTKEEVWRAASVCVDHATFVSHRTLKLAKRHAGNPTGWCDGCSEIIESRRAAAVRRRSPAPGQRRR